MILKTSAPVMSLTTVIQIHSFSPVTSDDEYYTSSDSSMDSDVWGDDEEDSDVEGDDRSFQLCGKYRLFIIKLDTLKVKECY